MVPHLHCNCGVNSMIEVEVSGAVVWSMGYPEVTVSDSAVELLLHSALLIRPKQQDYLQGF